MQHVTFRAPWSLCKNKECCVAASIHTCIARQLLWHFCGAVKPLSAYEMEFGMPQQLIEAASPLSVGQKRQLAASSGVLIIFSFKIFDQTTCVRTQALPKNARQTANARMDNCLCTRSRWNIIGMPLVQPNIIATSRPGVVHHASPGHALAMQGCCYTSEIHANCQKR